MSNNYQFIINKLKTLTNADRIITDEQEKIIYETDWRKRYYNKSICVVFPINKQEIIQIIIFCNQYNIKITPQGGNTSTCGAAVPSHKFKKNIIINFSKMNNILNINDTNGTMLAESGCILEQVIKAANEHNLYFPLNIGSKASCQIGANVATNAGGLNVCKYGSMRDLVLGLEVILPNGSIINQLNVLKKNNTNFDLKQLFIGSEGTLGIITQVNLKLFTKPIEYYTFMATIDNITTIINLLNHLKVSMLTISAFEVINYEACEIYNTQFINNQIPLYINNESWVILVELEISNDFNKDLITIILQQYLILDNIIIANSDSERQKLWHMRENIPLAEKKSHQSLKYDISLPLDNIEKFIIKTKQDLKKFDKIINKIIIFGHIADGSLHYNIPFILLIDNNSKARINNIVYNNIANMNGSISAEHGIGQAKVSLFRKYYDNESYALAKQIKQLIDPCNIFNPNKIFY